MIHPERDEKFMRQALREAAIAGENDEIPVGAVFVEGEERPRPQWSHELGSRGGKSISEL